MKSVQGFQSEDGTFFISSAECEEYEAELVLDTLCESHGVVPTKYKQMVRSSSLETMRYINAYQAREQEIARQAGTPEDQIWPEDANINQTLDSLERAHATPVDTRSNTGAEGVPETSQQLTTSSGERVRPVGRGKRAKDVSEAE